MRKVSAAGNEHLRNSSPAAKAFCDPPITRTISGGIIMKTSKLFLTLTVFLLTAFLFIGAVSAETDSVGGSQGTFRVNCNAENATVTFISVNGDEYNMGQIKDGHLDVPVYLTATPFTQIRVESEGTSVTYDIKEYPKEGQTLQVTIDFPADSGDAKPIGGSKGTFRINCNIENSTVTFISVNGDEYNMGQIKNGYLDVPVYLTATPFTQIRVDGEGYFVPITYDITEYPKEGQTLQITITFPTDPEDAPSNKTSGKTDTTESTPGITVLGALSAVLAAGLISRRRF